MKIEKECAWCGEKFTPRRSNAQCCKNVCSVRYSYYKHKENKGIANKLKKCVICGRFKNDWLFNKQGGIIKSVCKNCEKCGTGNLVAKFDTVKTFAEVEKFLYEMKAKSYWANHIDIFRLIDLYDKVYPHLQNVPSSSDIEKSVNTMFYKVANWWLSRKNKIESV